MTKTTTQILKKTFGGLSMPYYFRHFAFGVAMAVFVYYMTTKGGNPIKTEKLLFLIISTFLYPYSRFVYESIVDFIMGNNVFFVNAILSLIVTFFTILLCWVFAIFIAPLGLAYLYYYHSKESKTE